MSKIASASSPYKPPLIRYLVFDALNYVFFTFSAKLLNDTMLSSLIFWAMMGYCGNDRGSLILIPDTPPPPTRLFFTRRRA